MTQGPYLSHNRFHRDLVINLVAATVDTVCVGSIILILVTSKYGRTVCKMLFFCLFARQFRLYCCDDFSCFDFAQVLLRNTCLTFDSKMSLFLLFISLFDVKSWD